MDNSGYHFMCSSNSREHLTMIVYMLVIFLLGTSAGHSMTVEDIMAKNSERLSKAGGVEVRYNMTEKVNVTPDNKPMAQMQTVHGKYSIWLQGKMLRAEVNNELWSVPQRKYIPSHERHVYDGSVAMMAYDTIRQGAISKRSDIKDDIRMQAIISSLTLPIEKAEDWEVVNETADEVVIGRKAFINPNILGATRKEIHFDKLNDCVPTKIVLMKKNREPDYEMDIKYDQKNIVPASIDIRLILDNVPKLQQLQLESVKMNETFPSGFFNLDFPEDFVVMNEILGVQSDMQPRMKLPSVDMSEKKVDPEKKPAAPSVLEKKIDFAPKANRPPDRTPTPENPAVQTGSTSNNNWGPYAIFSSIAIVLVLIAIVRKSRR